MDVEQLKPGDRWSEHIEKALTQARAMVVYLGSLACGVGSIRRFASLSIEPQRKRRIFMTLGIGYSITPFTEFLNPLGW